MPRKFQFGDPGSGLQVCTPGTVGTVRFSTPVAVKNIC